MTPPRILVVDDDPDIRELVFFKLSGLGYDVHTRPDGDQGLDATRSLLPALVLLDWMMPGRNGIEVLEAVRSDPDDAVARTPVLVVTARSQPEDLALAESAGASGYLSKPFSLRELAERVAAEVGPAA
ncbi:response regulator transcription factor [Jatrophihabitans sp. YIM 134969]